MYEHLPLLELLQVMLSVWGGGGGGGGGDTKMNEMKAKRQKKDTFD